MYPSRLKPQLQGVMTTLQLSSFLKAISFLGLGYLVLSSMMVVVNFVIIFLKGYVNNMDVTKSCNALPSTNQWSSRGIQPRKRKFSNAQFSQIGRTGHSGQMMHCGHTILLTKHLLTILHIDLSLEKLVTYQSNQSIMHGG